MADVTDTDTYWQTASTVCTQKELEALELRDRHGLGTRLIAMHLNISRGSVRERLSNADRKIHDALRQQDQEPAA